MNRKKWSADIGLGLMLAVSTVFWLTGCSGDQATSESNNGQQVAQAPQPPAPPRTPQTSPQPADQERPSAGQSGNAPATVPSRPQAPSPGRQPNLGMTGGSGTSMSRNSNSRPQPKFDFKLDHEPKMGFGVGDLAPEIMGEDLDGNVFRLSDYRGKVVVVDFWGNW